MRKLILWIPIIAFLFFSRLFLLDSVPATIPHDEMVYAIQAKSYVVQGTTLNQQHRPWMISPFDSMYAELPASLMAIGYLFSNNPLVGAHLTSALMGISMPFILAWFFHGLWKRKDMAVGIGIVAVFNPLLWQMSRLGYDNWYSLWFYLLGAALMVHSNKKLQWASVLVFGLGFFNYQGFKLLLFPWVVVVFFLKLTAGASVPTWTVVRAALLKLKHNKAIATNRAKLLLPRISVVVFAFALTLFYGIVLLPNQAGVSNRLNSTIFSDSAKIAQLVDLERRQAFVSPLLSVYSNKATITLNFMLNRLANAFDLNLLFLQIEPAVSGFSVWVHGIFYWVEGLLMIIGVIWLFNKPKYRLNVSIILGSIVLLCIPTLINSGSEWHLLRTLLSYTMMLTLAGVGLTWVLKRRLTLVLILPFYFFAIGNFTYIYLYRYPVVSLDWGNYHERLVARYVTLLAESQPETKVSVHVSQADYYYWSYLLYSNRLTNDTKDHIAQEALINTKVPTQTFTLDNVTFTSGCDVDPATKTIVAETNFQNCQSAVSDFDRARIGAQQTATDSASILKQKSFNSIVAILDSGEKLYILDDPLCKGKKLKSYVFPTTYADIAVEKLNVDQFCLNWISDQSIVK